MILRSRRAGRPALLSAAILTGAVLTAALVAAACAGDETRPDRSPTTAPGVTTTVPTPSTVDDATFEQQAAQVDATVAAAAGDPCRLFGGFRQAAGLAEPTTPRQVELGVRAVAGYFRAIADAPPPGAESAVEPLRTAADRLATDGAANGWSVEWVRSAPAFADPALQTALGTYGSAAAQACGAPPPG